MSKAYEMISESLNEIITDLKETGGKNLKRENLSIKSSVPKKVKIKHNEKFVKTKPVRKLEVI